MKNPLKNLLGGSGNQNPVKAKLVVGEDEKEIEVSFNPSEYSVDLSNNDLLTNVEVNDFTTTLFFDTFEQGSDVREKTNPISALIFPTEEIKEIKRPPICRFEWGSFVYRGVVKEIKNKFTMFSSSGFPVRAELTLTLKSVLTAAEKKKLIAQEACRKLWRVRSTDRLDLIAYKTKKDVSKWRQIAEINDIKRPLSFPSPEDYGRILIIPD